MKRFSRRRSAMDRGLKRMARADQSRANLNLTVTALSSDVQTLHVHAVTAISRFDAKASA